MGSFSTPGHTASYKLAKMFLPQLEQGAHGVEAVGMLFFDDNTYVARAGDPVGERVGGGRRAGHAADAVRPVRVGAAWLRASSERRRRRELSRACGSAACRTCTPRWRATRRITSSLCERAQLVLGGLCSAEPRLGEPWSPFGRSDVDALRLVTVSIAGGLAYRRADARKRQARCLLRGRALFD
jgi:hypothetical protein